MEKLYRICKVCSFFIIVFGLATGLMFVLQKGKPVQKIIEQEINIDIYTLTKRTVNNDSTYIMYTESDYFIENAVSSALFIQESLKEAINLLIIDVDEMYQISVSKEGVAFAFVLLK